MIMTHGSYGRVETQRYVRCATPGQAPVGQKRKGGQTLIYSCIPLGLNTHMLGNNSVFQYYFKII